MGASTRLLLDGDVAGGINAARPDSRIDMCVGVGGTPEGIITACAVKALDGLILARLAPKDDAERQKAIDAGHDLDRVLDQDDLVTGDNAYFVATGVTDGALVAGVTRKQGMIRTSSIVLRSAHVPGELAICCCGECLLLQEILGHSYVFDVAFYSIYQRRTVHSSRSTDLF